MRRLTILSIFIIFQIGYVFGQGKYFPIPGEYFKPIFGNCEDIDIKPPQNGFWYVFSDRDNNPVYEGSLETAAMDLGRELLVIGQKGDKLQVIDATKIIVDQISGTWEYKPGEIKATVLQGWVPKNKLVLSNECLKVCDIDIPSAPKGLFNLQALYIYNVAAHDENHRFFTHIPNDYNSRLTALTISDRFGYIFKVQQIGNEIWYLIGQRSDIKIGGQEIILKGWKPRSQIELWKHRLALEYDWYNASERDVRLAVLVNKHNSTISEDQYNNSDFVDKEYNYFQGTPSKNYYSQRASGEGFRNVILEENDANIKVGVLKNSGEVPNEIIDPARGIANAIIKMLYQPKVIFVLDGTASIIDDQERKKRILETINTTITNIRENNRGKVINYQFGASIYRDWGHGTYKFETTETLTGNINEVANWIDTHLKRRPGSDRDQPEAVFYGLNKTFEHFQDQIEFFNPTFYVLIGDAGNHNRNDFTNVSSDVIKDYLNCNVSDLSVIQFSHRTDLGDNGAAFDDFQSQFKDVLSIFGNSVKQVMPEGEKVTFANRPGSFMAYPKRGEQFEANALAQIIESTLLNYNATLQQKIRQLAILLRGSETICMEAREELQQFINSYISDYNILGDDLEQITEWAIRFIVNAASNIKSEGSDIEIHPSEDYNFFNPGYVCMKYDFLDYAPFQHVAYISGNDLDNILQFSQKIANLKGGGIRLQIQRTWYYILINLMGVFQSTDQVNALTITEATSMLTGFRGNEIYDNIKIGQITQRNHFPDPVLFRYVYEWIITNGYLQSVKNGSWELSEKNLKSKKAVMNALLSINRMPNITNEKLNIMSDKLAKTDFRSLDEYYKNYPAEDIDPLYGLKAYWIETNFFSTIDNDFVRLLLEK